jgi:acyl-CoA reductase-like NAD-dependent aldehyde dehydrogenase
LLIESAERNEFLRLVTARIAAIRIGDPLDPGTQLGPAISERHRDGVRRRLASALERGVERLVLPNRALPESGYYLEPTVLLDVDPTDDVAQEEVFTGAE